MSLFDGQPLEEREVRAAMGARLCADCGCKFSRHDSKYGCEVLGCQCRRFRDSLDVEEKR